MTKVILFKKKDANLIIEPAFDLNYFDYKISETFFKDFGFTIIPIATTISSWFNGIYLLVIVLKKNFFKFSKNFANNL